MTSPEDDARSRPWGERTRAQRATTYGVLFLFGVVCSALWWSGAVDPSGPARMGYVVFPVVALAFGWRFVAELRRPSPDLPSGRPGHRDTSSPPR